MVENVLLRWTLGVLAGVAVFSGAVWTVSEVTVLEGEG
jgi:hypothetical protein